jgi:sarcosine oxidase subunit alpha
MNSTTSRRGLRLGEGTFSFNFDGRRYQAREGDTAASALLANGVRLMGRSIKARRRRGVLTAGPEEPNALLTVGDSFNCIPNVAAPQLVLRAGLLLRSQNRWPSLKFDVASVLQAGGGILGAGFYYKTFMWPSWHTYEPLIRRLAGLGSAPAACTLPQASIENFSCDVLIGGGGVAGLTAARAAARAGARVVVCEREPCLGGEIEFEDARIEGTGALAWLRELAVELKSRGARLLFETTVVGGRGGEVIAHAEPGGLAGANTLYRIRPRVFVVAMGATERPLTFVDNDLPGVMLLSAAERYGVRYGVRIAKRTVIFANHNRAYAAATRLAAAGMQICAIVDTRPESAITEARVAALREQLVRSGIECLYEQTVIAARGRAGVTAAEVGSITGTGHVRVIECDTILMSGGWTPVTHAGQQEGGTRRYVPDIAAFVADRQPDARMTVGAANGVFELSAICHEAQAIGERAARLAGQACSPVPPPKAQGDPAPELRPFWRSPAPRAAEKRQFVDFQNDVTVADLRSAVEEGFYEIEHAKRYTALGFGTDQGRLSGVLGAAIIAELRGEPLDRVGTSRLRQPFHPVTLKSLAGLRTGAALRVTRRTPLHKWHLAQGGVMGPTGLWMRPMHYGKAGADVARISALEATAVRTTGGISDASTLGKIEIAGPDAAAFLDYLYMTPASSLKIGRSRYAVNLREDGMVLDDGLLLRMGSDRFRATTSTGHAEEMLAHFEYYRALEFGTAQVVISDVTDAWAVIVVAGPKSREALLPILEDPSRPPVAALQHMDFTMARFAGAELLVLRASFSGELACELHCPPDSAASLADALVGAGMKPYGLEALDILRVEKGYLTHAELSGQTTPYDLGMEGFLKRKDRFVGSDLLDRPAFHEESRPRLVGVRAANGHAAFLAGAQLVGREDRNHPCGYITSSALSPALGEYIGLALVARSIGEGAEIIARDPLRLGDTTVRIAPIVHFDPSGERMRR